MRNVHLGLVLRPFFSSHYPLCLEPPRVVYNKTFLFRHFLQTFHVSAAIGKPNCLAIGKHLFAISKLLLWESGWNRGPSHWHQLAYIPSFTRRSAWVASTCTHRRKNSVQKEFATPFPKLINTSQTFKHREASSCCHTVKSSKSLVPKKTRIIKENQQRDNWSS